MNLAVRMGKRLVEDLINRFAGKCIVGAILFFQYYRSIIEYIIKDPKVGATPKLN